MLTCKEFMQEISDFLDEDVDQELRSKLDKHIAECPNCFVILDTTKRTIQVYKGLDPQPIPEDIHNRLMNAIDRKVSAKAGGQTSAR